VAGLFRYVPNMTYGEVPEHAKLVHANMLPVYIHFSLALLLGIAIPGFLAGWYHQAAALIAGGAT